MFAHQNPMIVIMLVSLISFSDNKLHDFMPVKPMAHALCTLYFCQRFIYFNPFNWTHHFFFSFDSVAVKRYILIDADCIKRRFKTSYARCTHSLAATNRVFVCLRTANEPKVGKKQLQQTNK